MNIYHIPYPKIINDSFTDKIFAHFDALLNKTKKDKFVLSVSKDINRCLKINSYYSAQIITPL